MANKNEPLANTRGGGNETAAGDLPFRLYSSTDSGTSQFSRLLDQAVAQAEHCEALAEHYAQLAEKHGRIKAELERLLILSEPIILEGAGALADYAEVLAEEVWGDD